MQAALKLSRARATGASSSPRRATCTRRRRARATPTSTATSASSPPAACRCASRRTTCTASRRRRAGTQRYDWTGYIPFEQLPRAFNPPGGAVVLANHKIVPPKYPHHITYEWQPPYRARAHRAAARRKSKHDVQASERMQADVVSLAVRELLPRFTAANPDHEVMKKLAAWDASMAADRAEPLIMAAWWREFARALYADELGDAFRANWARARRLPRQRAFRASGTGATTCARPSRKPASAC